MPCVLLAGGSPGTDCWNPGEPLIGADVIVGDLLDVTNYSSQNGIEAYAVGPAACNIGSQDLVWFSSGNQRPVLSYNMFRLKDHRFEQIGQSWVFHEFVPLTQNICGCGCGGGGNGNMLPIGCSSPHCCGLTGQQSVLAPKWQVNSFTGDFPFPADNPPYSGSVARRLQVHISDLNPSQNGGGLYFIEAQYVAPDDSASGNQNNNASYRRINIAMGTWSASLSGMTQREQPAVRAWKDNDPEVTETDVFIPNEGLLILAAKATDLGAGKWHYEYAVQNLNSHRSVGSFSVPVNECATVENLDFHDVDYHSGEPYDLTDWPAVVADGAVTWATTPYDENEFANALRWGTLYNFRFDADVPPGTGSVLFGLFRPGVPSTVEAVTVVPGGVPVSCDDANACTDDACDTLNGCSHMANSSACDDADPCTRPDLCNALGNCSGLPVVVLFGDIRPPGGNGIVDVDDVDCVLSGFIQPSECPEADLFPCGGDGVFDVDDISAMLTAFQDTYFCPHPCPP